MQCRRPIVAGQFYPGQYEACVGEIKECLEERALNKPLPETIRGGIVPHAGWVFSGGAAAMVFSAVKKQNKNVDTFIIFGAAHSYSGGKPSVYDKGCWQTPLGEILIDEELAEKTIASGLAESGRAAHQYEHSIEVQVPFIQYLFPGAKILPIIVPPMKDAIKLGEAVGDIISKEAEKKIVCIGSTDLTHYGPRYGFAPMGVGTHAIEWATNVNDRQFIDSTLKLKAEDILINAEENLNACGPGAAAATAAAAKKLGVKEGKLLCHTNSNEIMLKKMGTSSAESVGYAAIVF